MIKLKSNSLSQALIEMDSRNLSSKTLTVMLQMDVHDYLKLHFNLPFFKTVSLSAMENYKQ